MLFLQQELFGNSTSSSIEAASLGPNISTTAVWQSRKNLPSVVLHFQKGKYLKDNNVESALAFNHYDVTIVDMATTQWHFFSRREMRRACSEPMTQVYHSPNLRRWTWAPAAWRGNLDKHISAVIVCLRLAIHPNYTHVAHGFQRVPIRCTNQSFKKNPMHLSVLHFYLGIRRLQIESVVFISRKNRCEYLPQ